MSDVIRLYIDTLCDINLWVSDNLLNMFKFHAQAASGRQRSSVFDSGLSMPCSLLNML